MTEEALDCIRIFQKLGIIIRNQSVLLKGVNDSPELLGELFRKLTAIGVIPYYVFQCRPVRGVKNQFQVPIEKGAWIIDQAKSMQNGPGNVSVTVCHSLREKWKYSESRTIGRCCSNSIRQRITRTAAGSLQWNFSLTNVGLIRSHDQIIR